MGAYMGKRLPALLLLVGTATVADPAPFGLVIGTSTQGEAGTRYALHHLGQSSLTGGDVFDLDPRQLPLPGIERVRVVFGQDRILLGVLAELPRNRFAEIEDHLAARYHLEQSATSPSGARLTQLIDGNTEITLRAPADATSLRLDYVHRRLLDAADAQAAGAARKRLAEAENL